MIYARARPWPAAAAPATELAPAPGPPPDRGPLPGVVGDARGLAPGQAPARWGGELDDARGELWVRAVAPPAALLLGAALVTSGAGQWLVRTFFSMWIHELGHAVCAWLAGFAAFPGPWFTPVSRGRSALVVLLVAGAFATLAALGRRRRRHGWMAAGIAGLAAQLVCTLLPLQTARAFFYFGGDAGCMVIGAALLATIWADPAGPLGRGWLRWGFLVIGAFALVDPLHAWLRDPADHLGAFERGGLSDASTLLQVHGWRLGDLAARYVSLGVACLAVLAVGYAVALVRARARAAELRSRAPA